jgi:uncharacterized coiled-coil protein SlyX
LRANHETKSDQGPIWVAGFVFASLISALPTRCLAQDAVFEALKKQMAEMQEQKKKMAQRIEQLEQKKSVQTEAVAAAQRTQPPAPGTGTRVHR